MALVPNLRKLSSNSSGTSFNLESSQGSNLGESTLEPHHHQTSLLRSKYSLFSPYKNNFDLLRNQNIKMMMMIYFIYFIFIISSYHQTKAAFSMPENINYNNNNNNNIIQHNDNIVRNSSSTYEYGLLQSLPKHNIIKREVFTFTTPVWNENDINSHYYGHNRNHKKRKSIRSSSQEQNVSSNRSPRQIDHPILQRNNETIFCNCYRVISAGFNFRRLMKKYGNGTDSDLTNIISSKCFFRELFFNCIKLKEENQTDDGNSNHENERKRNNKNKRKCNEKEINKARRVIANLLWKSRTCIYGDTRKSR